MSLRIFSAGIALLVSACGGAADTRVDDNAAQDTAAVPAAGERIACAIGDAALADICTIERTASDQSEIVTIRHPNGGFRRLRVTADGVAAADGAEAVAIVSQGNGMTEVAIADARYRLPTGR